MWIQLIRPIWIIFLVQLRQMRSLLTVLHSSIQFIQQHFVRWYILLLYLQSVSLFCEFSVHVWFVLLSDSKKCVTDIQPGMQYQYEIRWWMHNICCNANGCQLRQPAAGRFEKCYIWPVSRDSIGLIYIQPNSRIIPAPTRLTMYRMQRNV